MKKASSSELGMGRRWLASMRREEIKIGRMPNFDNGVRHHTARRERSAPLSDRGRSQTHSDRLTADEYIT
jgi:hypothetical protein